MSFQGSVALAEIPEGFDPHVFDPEELAYIFWQGSWAATRRRTQIAPDGDWTIWAILAGRGAGKTRTAAETLAGWAYNSPGTRWLVSGRTTGDMRSVCFEGDSGLLSVIPDQLIADYNRSLFELKIRTIGGGDCSLIKGIGADKPDAFRGPQFHGGWLDELAAWQRIQASWDMIMFGMRLGLHPKIIVSTTPRAKPLIRQISENKLAFPTTVTRESSYANRANLAPTYWKQLSQYEGTQIGRQEIHGEVLDAEEAAVIKRSWWNLWRPKIERPNSQGEMKNKPLLPKLEFVLMSLDTAFTEKTRDQKTGEPDMSACSVWGFFQLSVDSIKPGVKVPKAGAILLDCWEEQIGLPDLIDRVKKEMKLPYGDEEQEPIIHNDGRFSIKPHEVGRKPDLILIEEKGSGISLRQMLAREQIPTAGYNPGRADKLARLHAVSHLFASGYIWVPESSSNPDKPQTWAEPLLTQVCTFSGTGSVDHDDYVDTTSQALRYFADRLQVSTTLKRDPDKEAEERAEAEANRRAARNPYA